jgi:vacuolar-type H+-ATPase subunit E/Vma4
VAAESLLREVEDKRKKTLEQLASEYAQKIAEVKDRATAERQRILENAKRIALEQSQREKIRIDGAAKLQAKKLVFDATEKMLENNLSALRQAFAEWAGSKQYQELLPKMIKYASKRLGGEIRVVCRADDESALKRWGADIESANLKSIGGFKAEKKDGTLELDLTFEEILRSQEDDVRRALLGGA